MEKNLIFANILKGMKKAGQMSHEKQFCVDDRKIYRIMKFVLRLRRSLVVNGCNNVRFL